MGSNGVPLPIHRDRCHGRTVPWWRHLRHQPGQARHPERLLRRGQPVGARLACSPTRPTAATRPATSSAIYTAPDGKTVDDPAFKKKILDNLAQVEKDHPDQILRSIGYFKSPDVLKNMADADKTARVHVDPAQGRQRRHDPEQLQGTSQDDLSRRDRRRQRQAGRPATAGQRADRHHRRRPEARRGAAIPLVAVVLFFVFGGVVAATLPAIIGGLTIAGALGIMRLIAEFTPVHFFAQPVVTLMGLGIAIDYGLFMVSRFREEIAEGYDTEAAVRRTVMTSGRTVMFSAVILVGVVGAAAAVPAGLPQVDHLRDHRLGHAGGDPVDHRAGRRTGHPRARTSTRSACGRCCGFRSSRNWKPSDTIINWLAEKTQKTKTREEVEKGFWGKLVNRVMKRPAAVRRADRHRDDPADHPARDSSRSAASARSTCRRTTRCARRRRSSTRPSPASAPSR